MPANLSSRMKLSLPKLGYAIQAPGLPKWLQALPYAAYAVGAHKAMKVLKILSNSAGPTKGYCRSLGGRAEISS